ncbi:hypothetical protein L204_104167 [Cryptococcus depauperatus]|nr:hypothetical protein L204_05012 [Cryptococcus depauperatus CBS 7855]
MDPRRRESIAQLIPCELDFDGSATTISSTSPPLPSSSTGFSEMADMTVGNVESADGIDGNESKKKIERRRTGCLSCRVRKKKCDEARPVCATCTRLGIKCMGYGVKRPGWLRGKENAAKAKEHLKATVVKRSAATKGKQLDSPEQDSAVDRSIFVSSTVGLSLDDSDWKDGSMMGRTWQNPAKNLYESVYREQYEECFDASDNGLTRVASLSYVDGVNQPIAVPASNLEMESSAKSMFSRAGQETNSELDELWTSFVGNTCPVSWDTIPTQSLLIQPPMQPSTYFHVSSPTTDLSLALPQPPSQRTPNDMNYLKHYLQVVMPVQYPVRGISLAMGDFIAPLALSDSSVLASISSLAALHLVSQRTKNRNRLFTVPPSSSRTTSASIITPASGTFRVGSGSISEIGDDEAIVATASHHRALKRLRFLSLKDLTQEEVIVSVLSAISYHIFSGGTSRHLKEILEINQKCLAAAIASSPELSQDESSTAPIPTSPWHRYRCHIEHMLWTDIIASVSIGVTSRLLPTYRKILLHLPTDRVVARGTGATVFVLMDKVMGCDSTTLLAYAEIAALHEWRTKVERLGCLSFKELLRRASVVEKLFDERAWRESHLLGYHHYQDPCTEREEWSGGASRGLRRIMSEVYYGGARVFLASVVNGSWPKVPDVASAVQDTLQALNRLSLEYPHMSGMNRTLVLPITLAGVHCDTLTQRNFIRSCFEKMGPDAKAFGNTAPAMELIEEVWRRRAEAEEKYNEKGQETSKSVDWRNVMKDLGWESGILLI